MGVGVRAVSRLLVLGAASLHAAAPSLGGTPPSIANCSLQSHDARRTRRAESSLGVLFVHDSAQPKWAAHAHHGPLAADLPRSHATDSAQFHADLLQNGSTLPTTRPDDCVYGVRCKNGTHTRAAAHRNGQQTVCKSQTDHNIRVPSMMLRRNRHRNRGAAGVTRACGPHPLVDRAFGKTVNSNCPNWQYL